MIFICYEGPVKGRSENILGKIWLKFWIQKIIIKNPEFIEMQSGEGVHSTSVF